MTRYSAKPGAARSPAGAFDPIAILNEHMRAAGTLRWRHYFAPVAVLSDDLPVPILGIMLLIWQLRERDLQQLYPLDSLESRLAFVYWCMTHGRREYRALKQAELFVESIGRQAGFDLSGLDAHDAAHAISVHMLLALRARTDLSFDIADSGHRRAFLYWYLCHGRAELGCDGEMLAPWQVSYLLAESSTPGLNRLQQLIYQARPELRQRYSLPAALPHYLAWFRQFMVETGLIFAVQNIARQRPVAPVEPMPFGVNVVGYAHGQLGIGEDARMACSALLSERVPFLLLDFAPGANVPQGDRSMAQHVAGEARYGINLFCLTAQEHARCFAERGSELLEGRVNIGYWPWELAAWPSEWEHFLNLADEVWLSSPHTFHALQPVSDVPLRLMPMAVVVDEVAARSRASFGLPPHDYLYLFAFDLNSSARRKNPHACLSAFLQAFPEDKAQAVGLVIKVHPPSAPDPQWEALKRMQALDRRIHLVEETLDRADLLALYDVCDCFVSLHRAEGFGRCIAEAMLLGKPVITTDYSGNLAFTRHDNALLVDYRLIDLQAGDYPHGAGQAWAEPSVDDAALKMRRVAGQGAREEMAAMAARGQQQIACRHHPRSVGMRYAAALFEIWSRRLHAALGEVGP